MEDKDEVHAAGVLDILFLPSPMPLSEEVRAMSHLPLESLAEVVGGRVDKAQRRSMGRVARHQFRRSVRNKSYSNRNRFNEMFEGKTARDELTAEMMLSCLDAGYHPNLDGYSSECIITVGDIAESIRRSPVSFCGLPVRVGEAVVFSLEVSEPELVAKKRALGEHTAEWHTWHILANAWQEIGRSRPGFDWWGVAITKTKDDAKQFFDTGLTPDEVGSLIDLAGRVEVEDLPLVIRHGINPDMIAETRHTRRKA